MGKSHTSRAVRVEPLQFHHLSHDLRGPLNSVLGFTELLLEGIDGPLNDVQKEDLTAIYQSGTQLLRLINAVVDAGKLDAGQLKLSHGPVSLSAVVQSVTESIVPTGTAPDFGVNVATDTPMVWADRSRVDEIVAALIHYLAGNLKSGHIEFSATADEQRAGLKLQADVAIPPEKLVQLFELSAEVDAAGHSKITAGGVFLPLACKLAQAQNGSLTVESSPDSGTVFELRLPRYRPESD